MTMRGKVTSQAVRSGGKGAAAVAFSEARCWNTGTVPGERRRAAGRAAEESQGAAHPQQHQARPGTGARKVFHVRAVTRIIRLLPWRPDRRHIEVSTTHSIVLRVHLPEVLPRDRGCANCILPPSQKACMRFSTLAVAARRTWARKGTQVFAGNEGASRRAGGKPQGHLALLPFTSGYGQAHWAVNAR